MIEKLGMSGEVTVSIRKGNKQKIVNSINSEIKNTVASSLRSAQSYFVGGSLFGTDNFATPTSGENGIVVHTSSTTYETKMTSVSVNLSSNTLTLVSSTRADGSSFSLTGAKCGHDYGSDAFATDYASTTFSQSVADGQQLDLSWVITLS